MLLGSSVGQTQAPPCSRLCPQGGDSFTKQLGSVVTPSQLPYQLGKKSLRLTPTQPLSFPSCWCPAFPERRDKTPSFTYRHSLRGLPLALVSLWGCFPGNSASEGMLCFTLFPGRGWRNFHSVIGIGNGWVGRNGSKAIRDRECFQST